MAVSGTNSASNHIREILNSVLNTVSDQAIKMSSEQRKRTNPNPETLQLSIAELPNELVMKIFSYLPRFEDNTNTSLSASDLHTRIYFTTPRQNYTDLASATSVCKTWKEIGELPKLWENFKLPINPHVTSDDLFEVLEFKRFANISTVFYTGDELFSPAAVQFEIRARVEESSVPAHLLNKACKVLGQLPFKIIYKECTGQKRKLDEDSSEDEIDNIKNIGPELLLKMSNMKSSIKTDMVSLQKTSNRTESLLAGTQYKTNKIQQAVHNLSELVENFSVRVIMLEACLRVTERKNREQLDQLNKSTTKINQMSLDELKRKKESKNKKCCECKQGQPCKTNKPVLNCTICKKIHPLSLYFCTKMPHFIPYKNDLIWAPTQICAMCLSTTGTTCTNCVVPKYALCEAKKVNNLICNCGDKEHIDIQAHFKQNFVPTLGMKNVSNWYRSKNLANGKKRAI